MSSRQARKELNEKYFYERICSIENPHRYVKHIFNRHQFEDRIPKAKRSLMKERINANIPIAYEMWDNPDNTLYRKAPLWEEDFETTFNMRTEHILNVLKADLTCVLMSMEDIGFPCDAPMFRVSLTMGLESQFINLFTIGGFHIMLDDSIASFSIEKAFVSRCNTKGRGDIEELSQIHSITDMLDNVISIVKSRREVDSNE